MMNNSSSGATIIALDKLLDSKDKISKSDAKGLMVVDAHNIRTTTDEVVFRYARLMAVLTEREWADTYERLMRPDEAKRRFEEFRAAITEAEEGAFEELEDYAQGILEAIAGHHDDGWNAPGVLQEAVEHITDAMAGLF